MWEVWLWAALCSGLVLSAPHLGESTELALLLVHESPQQSPLVLRRITPKSVFLAPTFTSCSEGYRQDSMGRCVKVVKLNQQAQWEFFLQKLNSMYALPVEPPKRDTAPLRFPIPIEEDPASTTTTTAEPTMATSTVEPTMTPFMIVVPNTTVPVETTELSTTEGTTATTLLTEETVTASTIRTTIDTDSTTTGGTTAMETSTMTTSMKCEDCEDAQETVVTETFAPAKSTVRFPDFPDQRMRPSSASSYVRFPESYPSSVVSPYWWPHSWERTQPVWPQNTHHRPNSYRPHWSAPF